MAKNPNNKEGPFLGPPTGVLQTVKSAIGITRIGNGTQPIEHGWGPTTPATDRNGAVTVKQRD